MPEFESEILISNALEVHRVLSERRLEGSLYKNNNQMKNPLMVEFLFYFGSVHRVKVLKIMKLN